jgi:hypothetical protein
MSVLLTRSTSAITTWQWTEAAITLAVSSGGSDTPSLARPARLLGGDYSSVPFATPQAAIDSLPKGLNHDVVVAISAGTFSGAAMQGFVGQGRLDFHGATALATITSGSNAGTAGSGTSTTSMNKPTAASNWTSADLRGKFLLITSGGGASGDASFPTIRPIKSNTTTSLTVSSVVGMDSTTIFQIVDMATEFTEAVQTPGGFTVRLAVVDCQVRVRAGRFYVNEDGGNFWHPQKNAEHNADFYMRKGVARIRAAVPAGTPVAITEYGFPQDQTSFTGLGLDAAGLIQQVVDTSNSLGLEGLIWWQIFDNEEQSLGVPRGFCLYDRNGNSTDAGARNSAGDKYAEILGG